MNTSISVAKPIGVVEAEVIRNGVKRSTKFTNQLTEHFFNQVCYADASYSHRPNWFSTSSSSNVSVIFSSITLTTNTEPMDYSSLDMVVEGTILGGTPLYNRSLSNTTIDGITYRRYTVRATYSQGSIVGGVGSVYLINNYNGGNNGPPGTVGKPVAGVLMGGNDSPTPLTLTEEDQLILTYRIYLPIPEDEFILTDTRTATITSGPEGEQITREVEYKLYVNPNRFYNSSNGVGRYPANSNDGGTVLRDSQTSGNSWSSGNTTTPYTCRVANVSDRELKLVACRYDLTLRPTMGDREFLYLGLSGYNNSPLSAQQLYITFEPGLLKSEEELLQFSIIAGVRFEDADIDIGSLLEDGD